jgi:transcriptional regulator with XRE-family HTH domain
MDQPMVKPSVRPYSRYSEEAVALLGQLIRRNRIERRMTVAELAERAGVSRGLMQRAERGDPGCAIGAVFDAAEFVGVRLFDADRAALSSTRETTAKTLALLPRVVRARKPEAQDDF